MNKLTVDQDKKLQDVIDAIASVGVNDVTDDIKSHIDIMTIAVKTFRDSLPFSPSYYQLSRDRVSDAPQPSDWEPQTILEHDLLDLLRALHALNTASGIYQLYIRLENASDAIYDVQLTSSMEYSDDEPQFDGKPAAF